MKKTTTSSFGTGKRESHDASEFYNRNLFNGLETDTQPPELVAVPTPSEWSDRVYCQSATNMRQIPANAVGLAFTSPPYNVGKEYDDDISLPDYLALIKMVAQEVYRVLRPGGRYIINIANLGRKPYIPLHSYFYDLHMELGFLPMGEIIWQKAIGASSSCAWGSWLSAKAPRLRDVHEYLLVFAKQDFSRPDKGESDIGRNEFMEATLSIWQIPPASARRVGHPAPFPVELAERVIKLYSYVGDVVLDPFAGSGSTCVAATLNDRHYVGFDISPEYCLLAERRLAEEQAVVSTKEKTTGLTSSLRAKTECSELSVGFGLLGIEPPSDLPADQVQHLFADTLPPEKYTGFQREFQNPKNKAMYQQLYQVGATLRQTYPLFREINHLEWCGPERQAATTSAAKDLLAANTPISVKAKSNLVLNASPFNVFRAIPQGTVPAQQSDNWYVETDVAGFQALYDVVRHIVLDDVTLDHLPQKVVEFEQEASRSDRRTVQSIIKQLPPADKKRFNKQYVAMCHEVARVSARIFNQNIETARQSNAWSAILEQIVKYFFRLDATEYILAGIDGTTEFAVIVPDLTRWKQTWRVKSIEAQPNLKRQQSVVNLLVGYESKKGRQSQTAKFHVEIRWSHGKFCGAPEAKLYKDFLWTEIAFLESLLA